MSLWHRSGIISHFHYQFWSFKFFLNNTIYSRVQVNNIPDIFHLLKSEKCARHPSQNTLKEYYYRDDHRNLNNTTNFDKVKYQYVKCLMVK